MICRYFQGGGKQNSRENNLGHSLKIAPWEKGSLPPADQV